MANRPRLKMPVSERAKQFMPFAAVQGVEAAYAKKEQALGLAPRRLPAEERAAEVNAALTALVRGQEALVTYYLDGEYVALRGRTEKLDAPAGVLRIGGAAIPIEDIVDVAPGRGGQNQE